VDTAGAASNSVQALSVRIVSHLPESGISPQERAPHNSKRYAEFTFPASVYWNAHRIYRTLANTCDAFRPT
jgi:hypothetical protein